MDMNKTLLDTITANGRYALFGLPATEELAGRTAGLPDGSTLRFGKELAVKCGDDLFLTEAGGRLLLIEELPDESLNALDAEAETAGASALPEALEGWETDLSFASGCVLTALFRGGTLTLSPSPEPVVVNVFGSGEAPAAPGTPEAPETAPVTLPLRAVEVGEKRFLLRFPETGETVFLDGRRFLLYALFGGRIAAGFVEVPPRA